MTIIVYKVNGLARWRGTIQSDFNIIIILVNILGGYNMKKIARKILRLFSSNHVAGVSVSLKSFNVSFEIKQMCRHNAVIENRDLGHEKK